MDIEQVSAFEPDPDDALRAPSALGVGRFGVAQKRDAKDAKEEQKGRKELGLASLQATCFGLKLPTGHEPQTRL
ncbi:MAG: hypothetical protein R3F18_12130 [Lysobacterales bacterium]|nr:hypothetical protein [Xanthomonadales bacterium]